MTSLRGVRLLDLSTGLAGSLAGGLMSDFGAEVIKIVSAGSQAAATPPELVYGDRSKTCLGFDEGDDAHRAAVARLLAGCDICITDGSRMAERFGLTARGEDGDGRIFLSLPSYHDEDAWIGGEESAGLLHAISGFAAFQASYSGAPVDAVYPYILIVQGIWAAACGVAALIERETSGLGQSVRVGGAHAANIFNTMLYTRSDGEPDADRAVGPGGQNPLYTNFTAGDGRVFFLGALGPKFGVRVLEATGSLHLLSDSRVGGDLSQLWSVANSRWVKASLQALFATQPASHWIDRFECHDIPCTLLNTRSDWLDSAPIEAIGMRIERDDPDHGRTVMPGVPIAASRASGSPRPIDRAGRDATIAAARSGTLWARPEAGRPEARPATAPRSGPLGGTRVLSLGSFVAGPYGAALLAELGAEVIKVEPPEGDPWREVGFRYNLGCESLAVDMRTEQGRQVFETLVASSDIIINNFRLGVMERLGLGYDRLQQLNARIVDVAVTAYGERGPLRLKPGYDAVLAAASGIMMAQGGEDEPVSASMPVVDYTTAALTAFAAVAALFHRGRCGEGQHISTSLAASSLLIQAGDLTDYAGRPPPRVGGRDFAGPGPFDRFYRAADGFIRIKAAELDEVRLRAAGLLVTTDALRSDPRAAIQQAVAELSASEAVRRFTAAGIPAVRARHASEVSRDPDLHARGLLESRTSQAGIGYTAVGRRAEFSRTPRTHRLFRSGLGESSRRILSQIGYADAAIDRLVAERAVIEGPHGDVAFMAPYR